MKAKKHIFILLILTIIFGTILVISGGENFVNKEYTIFDIAKKNTSNLYDSGTIEIGKLKLENTGFLPKKAKLKSYIICTMENNQYYSVGYSEGDYKGYYNYGESYGIFGARVDPTIDISGHQTKEISIGFSWYYTKPIENINDTYKKYNETLYLYEVSKEQNYYDFCTSAKKDKAIKQILLQIN